MSFWEIAGPGATSGIFGLASGLVSANQNSIRDKRNYERQKQFAQHGIRWRVADARAAGIHPLAALGANLHSYGPARIGGGSDYGLASMGQNISRAMAARMTEQERNFRDKQIEGLRLDNAIKRKELNRSPNTPATPAEGPLPSYADRFNTNVTPFDTELRPNTGVMVEPNRTTAAEAPGMAKGAKTGQTAIDLATGDATVIGAGDSVADTIESDIFLQGQNIFIRGTDITGNALKITVGDDSVVKDIIDLRNTLPKMPKGWEYRYHLGGWFKRHKKAGPWDTRLFDTIVAWDWPNSPDGKWWQGRHMRNLKRRWHPYIEQQRKAEKEARQRQVERLYRRGLKWEIR